MANNFSDETADNSSLMVIDNLTLDRNLNPDGRIRVSAKTAYVDREKDSIKLENCSIKYKKNKKDIYLTAEDCLYIEDKSIVLKNNLKGKINDVVFFTEKDGLLEFFINEGYGIIKNGVTIIKDNSSISAETVNIDKNAKELNFNGKVRATYEK
jgi:hypothetical protein